MHSNRALRASLLSFLLVLGSLTAFTAPTASAESTGERTDLYFTEYSTIFSEVLSFIFPDEFDSGGDDYYGDDSFFPNITSQMDTIRPTQEKDSIWLPNLFIDNESRLILPDPNLEKYLELILMWVVYNNPDLVKNFTQGDPILESILNDIDFELVNPFRVNEDFTYEGNETVELTGKIIFDLYLKSKSRILKKDNIKVTISKATSILGLDVFSEEIKNETAIIKTSLLPNRIKKQQIEIDLENQTVTIEPGDTLRFSVELIPDERFVGRILKIAENVFDLGGGKYLRKRAEVLSDKLLPIRRKIGENISMLLDMTNISLDGETNISLLDFISVTDLAELTDAIRGSAFIFASNSHPSRVILPVDLTSGNENRKVFYLHSENVMDTSQPSGTEANVALTSTATIWNGQTLGNRNRIIDDVSVNLFIRNLRTKKPVVVTLFDDTTEIKTSEPQDVGFDISANDPITFTFNDLDYELFYDHRLNLGVSLANGTSAGLLRKTQLLYDSENHPSSITVTFSETDNIQCTITSDPEEEKIIPGGELQYTLYIESVYDDDIDLDITDEKNGEWSYSVVDDVPISIKAGETEEINIIVTSDNNKNEAYGDMIDLTFIVSGKTGIAQNRTTVEVSEDAIEYDVGIIGQDESKNIKKGKNGIFYFIIENKNTGAEDDVDSYTITADSKNNWEVDSTDVIKDLIKGESTDLEDILVVVTVPKNTTFNSDVITVTVTSDSDPEAFAVINVTVNIIESSVFESITKFFEKAANKLGFDDIFGSKYAPLALVFILAIILILIIIILILILKRKTVQIICTERIEEIDPDGEAVFEITLKNPTRKTKIYEITSKVNPPSKKWQTATDREKITIASHKSESILLVAKPVETIETNDWTEVSLNVKVSGKKKSEQIITMVMVKEGKTILRIKDVFSWPREFKKGNRIITSFKLENKGGISARNVKVVLFINGKQKNKVEVTIPSGGYADVKIPWIALKGKNELQLKAIE